MGEKLITFAAAVDAIIKAGQAASEGHARSLAMRAIKSGEIRLSYAAAAIAEKAKESQKILSRSVEVEAHARGLKMSGSMLNILQSRARREAYHRGVGQQVSLAEFASPAFRPDLMAGKIQMNNGDLSDWIDRQSGITKPQRKRPRKQPKSEIARKAAKAIWPPDGKPPADLPPQHIYQAVANKMGELWPKMDIGKTTVLHALGLK